MAGPTEVEAAAAVAVGEEEAGSWVMRHTWFCVRVLGLA
jgi:hypothetical protein